MTGPSDQILDIEGLTVRFGGVVALSEVSFSVPRGEGIFGIIGPNGAGKTTLFNAISGFVRPQPGGVVRFEGQDIVGAPIHRIARRGITRTFQNISLIREQTVEQNILMGFHARLGYGALASLVPLPAVRRSEARARRRLEADLELLRIPRRFLREEAGALPLGLQKKIEVARALATEPRLLLLDEPAGGLNDRETAELADSLREVQARPNLTVVLIDHDMDLVMKLCTRVCVLNFGRRIAVGTPEEIRQDRGVIESYLGAADAA